MITLLVTGTHSTLPVRLWAMMRLGFTPDINALVALILLFTTALCLLAVRFLMPAEARCSARRPEGDRHDDRFRRAQDSALFRRSFPTCSTASAAGARRCGPSSAPSTTTLVMFGRARTGLYMNTYSVAEGENPYEIEIALVDDLKPDDVAVFGCDGPTERIAPWGEFLSPPRVPGGRRAASPTAWCATSATSGRWAFRCSMAASGRSTRKGAAR